MICRYLFSPFQAFINFYINSFRGLSSLSWSTLFTIFINAMGQMFLLFLTLYLNSINLSIGEISIVIACYNTGGLLGSYLGGEFAEKLGIRILFFSLITTAVLLIFVPLVDAYILKIALITILGVSNSVFKPASIYLLLYNSPDNDRTRLLGLRRVMVNLGMSVATVIGGILASINYSYVFWGESFFSALAFTALLYSVFKYKDTSFRITAHKDNKALFPYKRNLIKLYLLYFLLFINITVFAQLFFTYPIYLKEYYNLTNISFSRLFTINSVLILLVEVPLLNYIKNFSQTKLLILGSILLCNGLAILAISQDIKLAYLSVVVWTMGEILFFPSLLNLIVAYAGKKQGRSIGIYQITYSLAFLVGPSIGGFLYTIHNAKLLWFGCALISFLSFGIVTFFIDFKQLKTR